MINRHISLIFISLLCGCNSSGDSENNSQEQDKSTSPAATQQTNKTATEPKVLVESEPEPEYQVRMESTATSVDELNVPDGFSYNPASQHYLSIDISNYSTSKAYLSLYSEFVLSQDGSYYPNFNSRVASAPIESGTANLEYSLPSAQTTLLVEVQFYDGTTLIQHKFNVDSNSHNWVWQ